MWTEEHQHSVANKEQGVLTCVHKASCSGELVAICLLLNNLNTFSVGFHVLPEHQLKHFSNQVKQVCYSGQGETEINLS